MKSQKGETLLDVRLQVYSGNDSLLSIFSLRRYSNMQREYKDSHVIPWGISMELHVHVTIVIQAGHGRSCRHR